MPVYDGEIVDLQDSDGTVGTTAGNILFAAKSEDLARSRPFRATEAGLVVDQSRVHRLLAQILKDAQAIRDSLCH